MGRIFANPALDEEFNRKGYIILKVFDDKQCDELTAKHYSFGPKINDNFYATQNSLNADYRKAVEDYLNPVFTEKTKEIFYDREVLYTQYMIKQSGTNGECHMHQDWTFVPEPEYFSINFWCALQNVNELNGCMWFMPGSHRLKNYIRGRNVERYTLKEQEFIRKFLMIPIRLKKGEAVFFHSRLVHESRNNMSGTDRVSVAAMIIPRGVQPLHYMRSSSEDDNISELKVDGRFFVDLSCQTMPAGHPVERSFYYPHRFFGKFELVSTWLKYKLA